MKLELISRETIKPSSPTPPHLKTFNLSLIDQFTADVYIPFILFYSSPNQHTNDQNILLDQLKKSLSQTLTLYYPLAGILKDNNKIICDDSGVEILHARIGCHLSEVLNDAEPQNLVRFVPYTVHQHNEKALLVVQFNVFECGGVAIGVCISHKAVDSTSLCAFLTTWASINAHGGSAEEVPEDMHPRFDVAPCFPAKELPMAMHVLKTKGNIVTKRYIFDASMIASLRNKATSTTTNNPNSKGPSRVLSVIALLWKVAMAIDIHKHGLTPRASYMAVAASMRGKIDLPMPYLSFGNLVVIAPALAFEQNDNLVEKLGQAIAKIDREFVTKLQSGNEYFEYMMYLARKEQQFLRGEVGRYAVTSWCRFPFYEINFGWGKPVWVNVPSFEDKNFLVLMDTKVGEGIEAWVSLDEEDMAIFESQPEIQAFFN